VQHRFHNGDRDDGSDGDEVPDALPVKNEIEADKAGSQTGGRSVRGAEYESGPTKPCAPFRAHAEKAASGAYGREDFTVIRLHVIGKHRPRGENQEETAYRRRREHAFEQAREDDESDSEHEPVVVSTPEPRVLQNDLAEIPERRGKEGPHERQLLVWQPAALENLRQRVEPHASVGPHPMVLEEKDHIARNDERPLDDRGVEARLRRRPRCRTWCR
jgi:hypothetical protein